MDISTNTWKAQNKAYLWSKVFVLEQEHINITLLLYSLRMQWGCNKGPELFDTVWVAHPAGKPSKYQVSKLCVQAHDFN